MICFDAADLLNRDVKPVCLSVQPSIVESLIMAAIRSAYFIL